MTDTSGTTPGETPSAPLTRREAAARREPAAVDSAAQGVSAATGDESRRDAGTDPAAVFQAHVRAAREELENQVAQARTEFEEVNQRIKQRTGRDLIVASLIGIAIGAVLIASLVFFKWGFILFALAAALLGIFEFGRALTVAGRKVDLVPQLIGGTLIVLSGFFFDLWLHWVLVFTVIAFIVVWRLVAQMASHDGRTYGDVVDDVLVAGLIQLYVPFLTSLTLVTLRLDGGQWWVLAFIIIAVASDTGAYASGLSFGRTKMAPKISPNKTWEGFAGAAAAAIIAGVLVGLFMVGIPWWAGALFGAAVLASATLGDLGESMIKRDLGIKDMSSWLPGHGGVLDRLDSILPSAAIALAFSYLFIPLAAA